MPAQTKTEPVTTAPNTFPDADTRVLKPRHPADELSGARVISRDIGRASSMMLLPDGIQPTLGHLGMIADISTAQTLTADLAPGAGIRTLSLQLHLSSTLNAGEIVHATGDKSSISTVSGLSHSTAVASDGTPRMIATGRFIVVEEKHHQPGHPATEPLAAVPAPGDWDWAYGLTRRETGPGTAVVHAVPGKEIRNHGPMMHGGMQVRALELAMVAAIGDPTTPTMTDISVTYHRPVPADGDTPILMKAELIRRGRRTIIATATLETAAGRLLSTAEGIFLPDEYQD